MLKPLIATLAAATASVAFAQPPSDVPAFAYGASKPIEGQYIVVFKGTVPAPAALARQLAAQHGAQVLNTYGHAIKGFAARMSPQAAEALKRNPNVESVEQDATISLQETAISPPTVQPNATWGLDRIDQRSLPLSGSYTYQYTGAGVYAFVIDTGIRASHQEFAGRMAPGYDVITPGGSAEDCDGHGTHVAGTVGGTNYGVAKGVTLVPVRVLGCDGSGTNTGVIAGIDWVAGQSGKRPAVANMSLGGGKSSAVNAAVAGAVAKGVTMVVAAGNSNRNACNYSPASEPSAITVGATASNDARASYSNFGSCLDVFAPGSSITSAWYTSDAATSTISGTSMASPHVAGVAALALAANPEASPASIAQFIIDNATLNKVTSAGTGSPNRLAYSLGAGTPVTPTLTTVAVSNLVASASSVSKRSWSARAVVTVKAWTDSGFGAAVSGATVTGTFSPGGGASCVTDTSGQCTLRSPGIKSSFGSTQLTLTGVTGTNLVYDASKNSVSTIVLQK